ncbi:MAG: LacI family transcriptional regulator [Lentisphaerae bacterium]|nr:LacI family transcriptional regulator [Lentisphaerota bacterium]
MMKTKTSLADIAREANVSIATVSKVITGNFNSIRVSAATAQRVKEIAERLNYSPNINARVLAGKSLKMIGILVDSQPSPITFSLIAHIEKCAADAGYRIMIGQAHNSPEKLFECFCRFQQYSVDGMIVLAHEYPGHEEQIKSYFSHCKRTVMVGENYIPELPAVIINRQNAVIQAVAALQSSGRKRIGICHHADSELYFGSRGVANTLRTLIGPEHFYTCLQVEDNNTMQKSMTDVIENFILPEKLDAIFVPNDLHGAALLQQLPRYDIRVPEDVAVIGWDNEPFSSFLQPGLSTVDECVQKQAQAAFALLKEEMDNAQIQEPARRRTIEAEFIQRGSV